MHSNPPFRGHRRTLFASICLLLAARIASAAIAVSAPASPPGADANVVYSNFLGLSVELSFVNYYFGNTTDEIPQPFVQYLSALHARGSGQPVRVRLGGNSMDDSTYVPTQGNIIEFTNPDANVNDQPVDFGPQLFDVMNGVGEAVGAVQYLIGLSLRVPNNTNIPLLAGAASKALGSSLDAYLLGNEPDLYSLHGQRPNLSNYTTDDYIGDYSVVFKGLEQTAQGDVLQLDNIAGPTICCFWDLASLLQSGWLSDYSQQLKYITLQHYPQDVCSGTTAFGLGHYLQHSNTVSLAAWQKPGIEIAAQQKKPVVMDEFNSVSCGGVAGLSDTFGLAMWTADYALQMAAQGYTAAYLHTRERGVAYNPFDPPDAVPGGAGAWTTNAPFYGYLPVAEALSSTNGSRVVDLNVKNSMSNASVTSAGYAIYDGINSTVNSLVIFNYANVSGTTSDYAIDAAFVPTSQSSITIRYLTAPTVNEKTNIAWGGKTYAGVGDAIPVDATFSTSVPDKTLSCSGGCTIQVPGPGIAVVFFGNAPNATVTGTDGSAAPHSTSTSTSTSGSSSATSPPLRTGSNGAGRTASFGFLGALVFSVMLLL